MGTNYYKLKKPITHLSIEKPGGMHYKVKVWINHASTRFLVIREEELNDFLQIFSSEEVAYHSYYGGVEKGKVIKKMQNTDTLIVISKYGEIVKVEDLEKEIKNE